MSIRGSFGLAAASIVLAGLGGGVAGYVTGVPEPPPGPESGPTLPLPETSTTAPDRHSALAQRLPAEVYQGCVEAPEREDEERVTALTCASALAGADEVLITQWVDGPTMLSNFAESYGDKVDGKCGEYVGTPVEGRRSTWRDDGAPLACYVNSNEAAILLWEYPDFAIQVLAVRNDKNAQALFTWWQGATQHALT